MHPCSPALADMVARKTAQARFADQNSVDPADLERRIYRALRDLSRTRPRIVEFAPEIALQRALARVHKTRRQKWDQVQVTAQRATATTQKLTATS